MELPKFLEHWLRNFSSETLNILVFISFFVLVILVIYWFYNRKKFRELTHQIPASVVKNYLDSIIQNSTALKSSLFRGGGLDLADGTPSVVPVSTLPSGGISASGSAGGSEEVAQKNAEIASLRAMLVDKDKVIADLEGRVAAGGGTPASGGDSAELQGQLAALKDELAKKDEELKAAQAAGGAAPAAAAGNPELEKQLVDVTKERDDLKERLAEYEIIEEDLANLKRLQQENEQLKKSLADAGGTPPAPAAAEPPVEAAPAAETPAAEAAPEPAPAPEAVAETAPEPAPEPAAEAAPEAAAEPKAEAAAEVPENEGEQKSAEELLSEFEKMLG